MAALTGMPQRPLAAWRRPLAAPLPSLAALLLVLIGMAVTSEMPSAEVAGASPPGQASAIGSPAAGSSAGIAFEDPEASGDFGEDLVFSTAFRAAARPARVELLTRLPKDDVVTVTPAVVEASGPDTWRATVTQGGHVMPNALVHFRFRAVDDTGQAVEGPEARHRIWDDRFDWRRVAGEHVTVWWYEGDGSSADEALDIAEEGVRSAAALLGVDEIEPIDFFIYADDRDFRRALGPATRENVGGEAHPDIGTLYGLIEPRQVGSGWVRELVAHELAHLVFDAATRNPYGYPPRWLNEGLAVRLSRPDDTADRAQVAAAARLGTLIPLEGLAGQFPTRADRFGLAYAESAAAIDFLVRTHGQDALVRLVGAFGEGAGLDEAFVTATGKGFTAFEDAWLASLGVERPEPYGPQPGEPGPLPDAWAEPAPALLR